MTTLGQLSTGGSITYPSFNFNTAVFAPFNYSKWGEWDEGEWSECSVSCGTGVMKRTKTRKCIHSIKGTELEDSQCLDNKLLTGKSSETLSAKCYKKTCPSNSKWGAWDKGEWGTCSVSCGTGVMKRNDTRKCLSSESNAVIDDSICLSNKLLTGDSTQTVSSMCLNKMCPVHGKWGEWSSYGSCSAECGGGKKKRTRKCTPPKYGGNDCEGLAEELADCNKNACSSPGLWGEWSEWDECIEEENAAGEKVGKKKRTRECPIGKSCEGASEEIQDCDVGTNIFIYIAIAFVAVLGLWFAFGRGKKKAPQFHQMQQQQQQQQWQQQQQMQQPQNQQQQQQQQFI